MICPSDIPAWFLAHSRILEILSVVNKYGMRGRGHRTRWLFQGQPDWSRAQYCSSGEAEEGQGVGRAAPIRGLQAGQGRREGGSVTDQRTQAWWVLALPV